MHEKDVVGIVTFDLIDLLPTNQIIILPWHVDAYEEMFDVNRKIAQTTQNTVNFWRVSQRNGTLQGLSRRFHTLIWRPGDMVQNLESPRLSRRDDSTVMALRGMLSLIPYRRSTP